MKAKAKLQGSLVRQAFEVEDLRYRTNFTFVYEPTTKQVDCFDTSRGVGKRLDMTYREESGFLAPIGGPRNALLNPLDCTTAYEYFKKLYEKSLRMEERVAFLSWVDPDTIEPIDQLEEAEDDGARPCPFCDRLDCPKWGVEEAGHGYVGAPDDDEEPLL